MAKIKTEETSIYNWEDNSTYVKKPPFFDNLPDKPEGFKDIKARPLLILGDSITMTIFHQPDQYKRKPNWRVFCETSKYCKDLTHMEQEG